jgi:hypothetical protein
MKRRGGRIRLKKFKSHRRVKLSCVKMRDQYDGEKGNSTVQRGPKRPKKPEMERLKGLVGSNFLLSFGVEGNKDWGCLSVLLLNLLE